MKKVIPAFRDMKKHLDHPDIIKIMALSEYECSLERAAIKVQSYKNNEAGQLYGWVENGEILGVCSFLVHQTKVEIMGISVVEISRYFGIGSSMINALRTKYEMAIEAETDDDAVGFYRKCGFETKAIQKYNVRWWNCVLTAPIKETDEERQARIYPIILSDYDPAWPEWFEEEKANLERLVGLENIARISHFGSTSVPGLTAKPTVDILLELKGNIDIEELVVALPSSEYICLRREGNSLSEHDEIMVIKGYLTDGFAEKIYHIHVRYYGDWDELYFRDYLITHPETAAEYVELKRNLFKDFEHNRDGFTEAKGAFINEITDKAKMIAHYDALIDENNDPVHDSDPLKEYMNKWDGEAFIDTMQLTFDKSVLEIGVGTGRLAMRVCDKCGSFMGIDVSQKTIERAKENLKPFQNIRLVCGDFLAHHFQENFDLIYSSLTFMHIADKQTAIKKTAELLNPGGRFVLPISKDQQAIIDFGNRKIELYPDLSDETASFLTESGLLIEKHFETEFAVIFVAMKG